MKFWIGPERTLMGVFLICKGCYLGVRADGELIRHKNNCEAFRELSRPWLISMFMKYEQENPVPEMIVSLMRAKKNEGR